MAPDQPDGDGAPGDREPNPTGTPNPIGSGDPPPPAGRGGPTRGALKRDGTPCQARPYANGRCRVHGGETPAGVASPHYRNGRRSKYLRDLPRDLRAGYKAALAGPEQTALVDELAVLEARIG